MISINKKISRLGCLSLLAVCLVSLNGCAKAQLEAPSISWNSYTLELVWKKVENATYYNLYVNDSERASYSENEEADYISWDISSYVSGKKDAKVKLRAYSRGLSYSCSEYSNEVIVNC